MIGIKDVSPLCEHLNIRINLLGVLQKYTYLIVWYLIL